VACGLLHGSGLRLLEALQLGVKDVVAVETLIGAGASMIACS
jgi:hypothetical protein